MSDPRPDNVKKTAEVTISGHIKVESSTSSSSTSSGCESCGSSSASCVHVRVQQNTSSMFTIVNPPKKHPHSTVLTYLRSLVEEGVVNPAIQLEDTLVSICGPVFDNEHMYWYLDQTYSFEGCASILDVLNVGCEYVEIYHLSGSDRILVHKEEMKNFNLSKFEVHLGHSFEIRYIWYTKGDHSISPLLRGILHLQQDHLVLKGNMINRPSETCKHACAC